MRSGKEFLLAGLCVGALFAMLVTAASIPHRNVIQPGLPVAEAGSASVTTADPAATETPLSEPTTTDQPKGRVDPAKLAKIVPDAQLSMAIYDRQEKKLTMSYRTTVGYTSASLVKLLIALEALDQGTSSATVQEMLSRSDDETASRLWSTLGGPAIVTRWANRIGLPGTRPPTDPGHWGDTRITASDIVAIYRYLMEREPAAKREIILRALRGATKLGADGFKQYFGIPDAARDIPWAIKQGWSCCGPERDLHTTGLVGPDDRFIVVVLTAHPNSVSYETGSRRVTELVSALLSN